MSNVKEDEDKLVSQLKRLRGKNIKIVYREHEGAEPFTSVGKCVDANPSFVVVRGLDGFVHFIAISRKVHERDRGF